MTLHQKLKLTQSQNLVLTPQLREAIELLQLSHLDLATFVQNELDQNPFLESGPPGDLPLMSGGRASGGDPLNFEALVANPVSLRDHLLAQIHVDARTPLDQKIGSYLVDCLDGDGYLRTPLSEIAQALGIDPSAVEGALLQAQRCDPPGIFARDLQECLRLQLQDRGLFDGVAEQVLDHLPLLAAQGYTKLAALCQAPVAAIERLHAHIKNLNPRPAQGFTEGRVEAITPDVFVTPEDPHGWAVTLNMGNLPRVLANATYYAQIKESPLAAADRAFVQNTFQRASWLIKALDQRARTLLAVSQALVREQEAFFNRGLKFLRPMGLKDIAQATGLHESTISRVTTQKYMETPRGVFELKFFFASKITGAHAGDDHSSQAIRHRIQELIAGENKAKPLSDDKIVQLLAADKITIARRTVTKYRESLGIPPTPLRRVRTDK